MQIDPEIIRKYGNDICKSQHKQFVPILYHHKHPLTFKENKYNMLCRLRRKQPKLDYLSHEIKERHLATSSILFLKNNNGSRQE